MFWNNVIYIIIFTTHCDCSFIQMYRSIHSGTAHQPTLISIFSDTTWHCVSHWSTLSPELHLTTIHVTTNFFFFCIPQLRLWGSPFWMRCLRMWPFSIQPLRQSQSVFMDGARWVCFCCQHSPVWDMNVWIFWVCAMECMWAQTRPWFILSSERVLGKWSQNPC